MHGHVSKSPLLGARALKSLWCCQICLHFQSQLLLKSAWILLTVFTESYCSSKDFLFLQEQNSAN